MRPPMIWPVMVLALITACSGTAAPGSQTTEIRQEAFRSPLGNAESAEVIIHAPFENVTISALQESDQIIDAEVEYVGEMTFTSDAGSITLSEDPKGITVDSDRALQWTIGLHPDPALDLRVSLNSGQMALDAAGLNLAKLGLSMTSGVLEADLPKTLEPIGVDMGVAAGNATLNLPDGAKVDLTRADVGSGALRLNIGALADVDLGGIVIQAGRMVVDVPADAAVRIEIKGVAAGSVNLAFALVRLTGTDADEGIWETDGFSNADHQINIVIESIAAGSFELE